VQLHEVELLDFEVRARPVVELEKVPSVVVLRELVDAAAHLRGDEHAGVAAEQLPAELLAAAVAIDIRGVEERDSLLDGRIERRTCVLGRDRSPVRAELPGPEPDHAHRATQSVDRSLFHRGRFSQPIGQVHWSAFRSAGYRAR
jgi:hypothetical protein